MDHDYELADYDRTEAHIHDKERLSKPISYWRQIAPTIAAAEEMAREADKQAKQAKDRGVTQRKADYAGDKVSG
jgi:NADH-quinone oxidoreductase subunit I